MSNVKYRLDAIRYRNVSSDDIFFTRQPCQFIQNDNFYITSEKVKKRIQYSSCPMQNKYMYIHLYEIQSKYRKGFGFVFRRISVIKGHTDIITNSQLFINYSSVARLDSY